MTDLPDQLARLPRREPIDRIPRAVDGQRGLFTVDATWGTIQPLQLPGGVQTVGELEVIEHLTAGGLLVDTRQPEYVAQGTIPGAMAITHQDIVDELPGVAHSDPVVLFCNGPQCAATVQAVAALLASGWRAERLRYYRGGIHDWVTLGLPLTDPVNDV
jgi:rhodanese-related sulfurtransferase